MYVLRSIGVSIRTWGSVLRLVLRPVLWLPFVLVALIQLATLVTLIEFHRAPLTNVVVPVIRAVAGEQATHFPGFYFALPGLFAQVSLIISVILECLAIAAATLLFARAFGFEYGPESKRRIMQMWPRLIVVTAIPAALVFGLSELYGKIPAETALSSGVARWTLRFGYLVAFTLIQTFVAYATAWVVLRNWRPLAALWGSLRVSARTFLPTWIVIAVPVALVYPLHYLAQRVDLFVDKLSPETIGGVLVVRIICEIGLGFVLVGSITRLFVWRLEAR